MDPGMPRESMPSGNLTPAVTVHNLLSAFPQVESHAAGVTAAKAAAAEKAAAAAENGAGAGPTDEAVVEENNEYEVINSSN